MPISYALSKAQTLGLALALATPLAAGPARACSRALFTAPPNGASPSQVLTGRSMDWYIDIGSSLWVFPRGLQRVGGSQPGALRWTSRYGSVITSIYDVATGDGMNEKGLVANILYLGESDYGQSAGKPTLSVYAWGQYVLDTYATVAEAVAALGREPFRIDGSQEMPGGKRPAAHLSISDASGDSAVFEYIDGKLVIHHGRQYTVMTNSPVYSQQLALNTYWQGVGGTNFLPGTIRSADRYARAAYLLDALPRQLEPQLQQLVPGGTFLNQAKAGLLGVIRSVSVPFGIQDPSQPNIASTQWRTLADSRNLTYLFDSATSPNAVTVSLARFDLQSGAPTRQLKVAGATNLSGEVNDRFVVAQPFVFR